MYLKMGEWRFWEGGDFRRREILKNKV